MLHQILVTVYLDILETDVKMVCSRELANCLHQIPCDCFGCENGGTCTAPDTCDCVSGYTGDRCQNGMF